MGLHRCSARSAPAPSGLDISVRLDRMRIVYLNQPNRKSVSSVVLIALSNPAARL